MAIKAYRHLATCVLRPNQLCLNYSANHTDLYTSPTLFRLHTDATAFHLIGSRSGVPSFPWSSLHGRCTLHTCCRWLDLLSLCLLTFHPHANEHFFKAELEEISWKVFFSCVDIQEIYRSRPFLVICCSFDILRVPRSIK